MANFIPSQTYSAVWDMYCNMGKGIIANGQMDSYAGASLESPFNSYTDNRISVCGAADKAMYAFAGTCTYGECVQPIDNSALNVYRCEYFKEKMIYKLAYMLCRHYLDMEMFGQTDASTLNLFGNKLNALFNNGKISNEHISLKVDVVFDMLNAVLSHTDEFSGQFIGELVKMLTGEFFDDFYTTASVDERNVYATLKNLHYEYFVSVEGIGCADHTAEIWDANVVPNLTRPVIEEGNVVNLNYAARLPFWMMFDEEGKYINFLNHIYHYVDVNALKHNEKAILARIYELLLPVTKDNFINNFRNNHQLGTYTTNSGIAIPVFDTRYSVVDYNALKDEIDVWGGFYNFCAMKFPNVPTPNDEIALPRDRQDIYNAIVSLKSPIADLLKLVSNTDVPLNGTAIHSLLESAERRCQSISSLCDGVIFV